MKEKLTVKELIKALKNKQSRDNRELLDESAERLEELNAVANAYKEAFLIVTNVCHKLMEDRNNENLKENSN